MDRDTKPLHSNSASTNSLFSLVGKSSLTSISDHYDLGDLHQHVITDLDELPTITPTHSNPLTLEYRSRHVRFHNLLDTSVSKPSIGKVKFMVILIGLPATGKSTIANHLVRFIMSSFPSLRCSIFNAGQVRREFSSKESQVIFSDNPNEDLFNPRNSEKKDRYAKITLENLFNDLDSDLCDFAIFDATNSTKNRRDFIFNKLIQYNTNPQGRFLISPIVYQITCSNENFIKFNIHNKSFNQDYFNKPYKFAVSDFSQRLKYYYSQFVPFTASDFKEYLELCKSRGCDSGLFWFNIVNAGLSPSSEGNIFHFPEEFSNIIADLVNLVEDFTERYAQIYGYQYIERAAQFVKGVSVGPGSADPKVYLSILNEVIDDSYLKDLRLT